MNMLSAMLVHPRRRLPIANALPPWVTSLGLAVTVGIIYFFAARLSLALISRPDGVAVFWPAAGVSSGLLIALRPAAWPPILAGTAIATVIANLLGDRNIWSSVTFALCNAGEPAIVALLLQRFFGSPFRIGSVRQVFGLIGAAMIATALSGIVATVGYLYFHSSPAPPLTIWRNWLASDSIGIITIAPLIVGTLYAVRDPPPPRQLAECLLALIFVVALAGLIFRLPGEAWAVEIIVALFFPLSLWLAARCQPVFAAAAVAVIAIAVVWSTTFAMGVFGTRELPAHQHVLTAQAIIVATSSGALVLAALFAERRQHEVILVENESRLLAALRNGAVMAFEWRVSEGITQRSENAREILGLDADRPVLSDAFLERVHPADRERYGAHLRDLSFEKASYIVTYRWCRPDGREVWLEETGRGEFDSTGGLAKVVGLARDVSERKRAEAEVAASRKVAELADRSKSGFLAAASHDLRQPLQSLTLLSNALKPHQHTAAGHVLITRMERSLDSMKDVLDTLLDINRLETGVLIPTKTDILVRDLFGTIEADLCEAVAQKGLEWRLVQSRLTVRSDRRMLELMTRNLLANALRYTERGRILLGCRRAGDQVRIEVWDSGIGISEEQIPRIFDEYYQVQDRTHLGSFGLGLAIVQRLGNLLGHRVDVRSAQGQGSCFSIDVPLAHATTSASKGKTFPVRAEPAFRGTVLVIEDDSLVRSGIEMLLVAEGSNVVAVSNGHDALALISKKEVQPDLILSDFNLPGQMNGVQTIQAVRKALGRSIAAVVLTGDIRAEVLDAIAMHDLRVATKPVNADQLIRLVNESQAVAAVG